MKLYQTRSIILTSGLFVNLIICQFTDFIKTPQVFMRINVFFSGIFISLLCECKIQSNMYLYIKVIFENNPTIETCCIHVYVYLFSSLLNYKIQIVFYNTFYWHYHNYTLIPKQNKNIDTFYSQ